MPLRLGYLIPQFPGQTHIFFWRELEALQARGVPPENLARLRDRIGLIPSVRDPRSLAVSVLADVAAAAAPA